MNQIASNTSVFTDLDEFKNHEMVIVLNDQEANLKAFVAIHSTKLGSALGGTRLRNYDNDTEAVKDALNLSAAMSQKCAMAGLPWGGGKAVIVANDIKDHWAALAAYARLIEKLGGLFRTGTDVGVTDSDVREMAKYTQYMLGVAEYDRGDLTTAGVAAQGVYYSIKAACKKVFGDENLSGRTIGVKGVGKLGAEAARLCAKEGAKVYIADVDPSRCQALVNEGGNFQVVDPKEISKMALDVFVPCAFGQEITQENVNKLNFKIIAGGANNQLADSNLGDTLFERGILYVPDYIANAGGLIYVADELEKDGFNKSRVLERTSAIQRTLENVFERVDQERKSPSSIADELAAEILSKEIN